MISIKSRKISIIISLAIPFFLLSSCFNMKYDFKGGVTIRPEIKTFSVQYFDNRAQLVQPTFSQQFTDALRDYIQSNTNLRYINGLGDVDFSGSITSYQITPQAIAKGETAAMTRFTITISYSFLDSRNPEDNFEKSVSEFRDFSSTEQFSNVEAELSKEIMDVLVEQIFNAAFIRW